MEIMENIPKENQDDDEVGSEQELRIQEKDMQG